jgi:hypothetical protein
LYAGLDELGERHINPSPSYLYLSILKSHDEQHLIGHFLSLDFNALPYLVSVSSLCEEHVSDQQDDCANN